MADYAANTQDARVAAVHRRFDVPARVAVHGRVGVGRRTVAAALTAAGLSVIDSEQADVTVVVVAEAGKPEDAAMVRRGVPTVVVLNKADVAGVGTGGPLAVAARRAADLAATWECVVVPMSALLATATLDESLVAALQVLVTHPADMTSVDAFVAADHPLAADVRARLLATLDRFGVAHAVLAVADGVAPAAVTTRLRELSGVAAVAEAVCAAAAPARYRAVRAAVRALRLLAIAQRDAELTAFLRSDSAVLAVMAAAVDVVEAAGATVDRGDDAATHLRRAVHWQRYACGPVDRLHAACGADISRGSLRLLARTP
ncbi:hypothetical protein ACAG25_03615 [Mycobacterium sp. pV006]|uniref:hypothetical protein n=1 Tax=Mycobacterium sp. pV006 TaxID=3238983 RepID=UPI00351BC1AE